MKSAILLHKWPKQQFHVTVAAWKISAGGLSCSNTSKCPEKREFITELGLCWLFNSHHCNFSDDLFVYQIWIFYLQNLQMRDLNMLTCSWISKCWVVSMKLPNTQGCRYLHNSGTTSEWFCRSYCIRVHDFTVTLEFLISAVPYEHSPWKIR